MSEQIKQRVLAKCQQLLRENEVKPLGKRDPMRIYPNCKDIALSGGVFLRFGFREFRFGTANAPDFCSVYGALDAYHPFWSIAYKHLEI